ncbi:MAG: primosomal protein N' family DNA-binding protein, partial [Candidatus Limnocylindrales bacterium]
MPPLLELDLGTPPDGRALVEVAVDAPAGPGPRTFTYAVPPELAPLEAGEAVLVPFGRGERGVRQAMGIIIGPGTAPERGEIRPVAARIRSDGPLLPSLSLALAGRIAEHYLAPLAGVIRAMLPPGLLERVELVAEVTPVGEARLGSPEP